MDERGLSPDTSATLSQFFSCGWWFFISDQMVPDIFISSATDFLRLCFIFRLIPLILFHSLSLDSDGFILQAVPYSGPFPFYDLVHDVVLVCPPNQLFVCDLVLPFTFENVSNTFLFMNVWSFLIIVLIALHVSEPQSNTFHISIGNSDFISCWEVWCRLLHIVYKASNGSLGFLNPAFDTINWTPFWPVCSVNHYPVYHYGYM